MPETRDDGGALDATRRAGQHKVGACSSLFCRPRTFTPPLPAASSIRWLERFFPGRPRGPPAGKVVRKKRSNQQIDDAAGKGGVKVRGRQNKLEHAPRGAGPTRRVASRAPPSSLRLHMKNDHIPTAKKDAWRRDGQRPHQGPRNRKSPPAIHPAGRAAGDGPISAAVDRQTKASYVTYEAAEQAGLAMRGGHPLVGGVATRRRGKPNHRAAKNVMRRRSGGTGRLGRASCLRAQAHARKLLQVGAPSTSIFGFGPRARRTADDALRAASDFRCRALREEGVRHLETNKSMVDLKRDTNLRILLAARHLPSMRATVILNSLIPSPGWLAPTTINRRRREIRRTPSPAGRHRDLLFRLETRSLVLLDGAAHR